LDPITDWYSCWTRMSPSLCGIDAV
jgi:hypothetical protein